MCLQGLPPPPVNLLCALTCFEWQSCALALRLNLTGGIAWEKRRDFGPLLLSFMEWRLLRLMSALISINFSLFPIKPGKQQEHQSVFTWRGMNQHLSLTLSTRTSCCNVSWFFFVSFKLVIVLIHFFDFNFKPLIFGIENSALVYLFLI